MTTTAEILRRPLTAMQHADSFTPVEGGPTFKIASTMLDDNRKEVTVLTAHGPVFKYTPNMALYIRMPRSGWVRYDADSIRRFQRELLALGEADETGTAGPSIKVIPGGLSLLKIRRAPIPIRRLRPKKRRLQSIAP